MHSSFQMITSGEDNLSEMIQLDQYSDNVHITKANNQLRELCKPSLAIEQRHNAVLNPMQIVCIDLSD